MVVAKSRELIMEKWDTSNSDVLEVNVEWQNWKCKLVLDFWCTRNPLLTLLIDPACSACYSNPF